MVSSSRNLIKKKKLYILQEQHCRTILSRGRVGERRIISEMMPMKKRRKENNDVCCGLQKYLYVEFYVRRSVITDNVNSYKNFLCYLTEHPTGSLISFNWLLELEVCLDTFVTYLVVFGTKGLSVESVVFESDRTEFG